MSAALADNKVAANGVDGQQQLDKKECFQQATTETPTNETVIGEDNGDKDTSCSRRCKSPVPESGGGAELGPKDAAGSSTATTLSETPDQPHLDAECERLLRNAKRQVKQMMEEAVTKKFIHEESSSIISFCVSIDACLSHGLKRRALGLFKTNSSTALVQKIAKSCPEAQEIMSMVETEERRQEEEVKLARRQSAQAQAQQEQAAGGSSGGSQLTAGYSFRSSGKQPRLASNLNVHRRNLWLKCALMEKKLVGIVEHLAENANKYYEPDALMANCLSAQLLCSLLVGPCALEFSRSKTNDYYQFEEPSADELLKRHKLSNPIACLCSAPGGCHHAPPGLVRSPSCRHQRPQQQQRQPLADNSNSVARCQSVSVHDEKCESQSRPHAKSRAEATDGNNNNNNSSQWCGITQQQSSAATGQAIADDPSGQEGEKKLVACADLEGRENNLPARSPSTSGLARKGSSRRRPLSLKTNVRTGALVTECHHYCCQDISEHQQTRGYSFKSASIGSTANGLGASPNSASMQQQLCNGAPAGPMAMGGAKSPTRYAHPQGGQNGGPHCQQQEVWPAAWSPRVLHETLHQNSRSSLLYAKNNVQLDTQAHGTMAGYLSLHQTNSNDIVLNWIPNQLINGGHQMQQSASSSGGQPSYTKQQSCPCERGTFQASDHEAPSTPPSAAGPRARSLDSVKERDSEAQQSCPSSGLTASTCAGTSDCPSEVGRRKSTNGLSSPSEQHAGFSRGQVAVGGSYLDLVVSLSVSRIVLLHCHFGASQQADKQKLSEISSGSRADVDESLVDDDERPDGADPPASLDHTPRASTVDEASLIDCEQETLILVEADGVQRAPFKFPKGGLRWFLSCLESGLRPGRFLEPAIKPNDDKGVCETSSQERAQQLPDSLDLTSIGRLSPSGQLAGIDSPSAFSEPLASSSAGPSRLDVLLRRLPSLRRRSNDKSAVKSADASDSSQSNSHAASPIPPAQVSEQRARPFNYVYRIVSANQSEWPLQTPPHSALSVASSSSIGSALLAGKQATGKQQAASDDGVGQKFRWSLSRLARFSSSRGGSTSSSSFGVTTANHRATGLAGNNKRATMDSINSFGDSLDQQQQQFSSNTSTATSEQTRQQEPSNNMKRDSSSELIRIETKLKSLNKTSSEELMALRDHSILTLCEQMRKQILARAFYGWLAYCRRTKIVNNHLAKLIKLDEMDLVATEVEVDELEELQRGLTRQKWDEFRLTSPERADDELARAVNKLVYYGGIESNELRAEVWPYLLGHYQFGDTQERRDAKDEASRLAYESSWRDWVQIERAVKRRDREILASNMAKVARRQQRLKEMAGEHERAAGRSKARSISEPSDGMGAEASDGVEGGNCQGDEEDEFEVNGELGGEEEEFEDEEAEEDDESEDEDAELEVGRVASSLDSKRGQLQRADGLRARQRRASVSDHKRWPAFSEQDGGLLSEDRDRRFSEASSGRTSGINMRFKQRQQQLRRKRKRAGKRRFRLESTGSVGSDASITDQFGNNIHRIDKDVQRCDRNFWYFKDTRNLDKLRNIMCSYVWQHLDVGYVQGMCDLAAPFLVIFDDELMAFNCFSQLMKRMVANFPHGSTMDQHFESLKYLMQVLDPKLFEVLQNNGDYTHFYFCYRWLLLDFKRELAYDDVYRVWETIWSARQVATDHFVVFMALAMVRYYRDIIIENNMDFTDTIKFFNEMAERHDVKRIIALAQDSIVELESLIRA